MEVGAARLLRQQREHRSHRTAYTLFNVRTGYDYKPWKLGVFFEARNLTNVTYASSVVVDAANRRFFEPGDGRAFYGGAANGDGDDSVSRPRACSLLPRPARAARRRGRRARARPAGSRSRTRPAATRCTSRRRRSPWAPTAADRGLDAPGGHDANTVLRRPGRATDGAPVRVNPAGTSVDSLHQAPGLAVGPGGEVYVTWSSSKPKPEGVLFASDLFLSRSLDGGRTFEAPLRVNDDRPISHSFEDLAVTPDGTVLVGWIDSRDGARRPPPTSRA